MVAKKQKTEKKIVTDSNIPVRQFYKKPSKSSKGEPGKFPFTMGIHAGMYRDRFWTMRQYAGFGDAKQSNARYKFMLEKGQTGISMAFDLPTQIGHDPDSVQAEGEVGKVGVSISSLKDMQTVFNGIELGILLHQHFWLITLLLANHKDSQVNSLEEQHKTIFSRNMLQEIRTSIHQNHQ